MFTEQNTVEEMLLDILMGKDESGRMNDESEYSFLAETSQYKDSSLRWLCLPADQLSRPYSDVFVEEKVRAALIRLNSEIAEKPERADEVLYRLRAIPLSVESDGLVRANEHFAEWLRGEKTMPFGKNGEHTPVRLIDFDDPANNDYIATNQWVFPVKEGGRRFDIVLLVNGFPLVIGEAKTPVRPAVTWVDGASDIHSGYERNVPAMFVPNVFSFATEGKAFRYGSIRMPIETWGPWHDPENKNEGTLADVRRSVQRMLQPQIVLDILQNFTIFATDKKHRRIKIICRYQEGDLGRRMRDALPNAFLFGLTGTPINKRDRNTFWAFGSIEDEQGYLSRYSFQDSIRDKATLPLHFEATEIKLRVDKEAIDEAYSQITGYLSEQDRDDLAKRAAKLAVLIKTPERVRTIVGHIVRHFRSTIEPNGFKAQVVTFDRECCALYKRAMDELIAPEASAVVIYTHGGKDDPFKDYKLGKEEEEKLLDRFRDPADPLQFLIVTSKLLTGFDAPILQAMYLDKPMRDHNLLQAITRTNRPYPGKTHGLIVDYLGIFDDVGQALDFDEKAVQQVITNLDELKKIFPGQVARCLAFFPNVDRAVSGYEGLIAAQDCLPDNETRDRFASEYSMLSRLWEALSPDPCLAPYTVDYKWLTQVYESVKPPSGHGKLLWHALGAKTIELIHDNVHIEAIRDDLETLVMDAEVLEGILEAEGIKKKAKEIEIKLIARLCKHKNNPKFIALGERLEKLRERHEQGLLSSIDFLKELLTLAREVVEAEKQVDPVDEQAKAKAALSELFSEVKNVNTPKMVERIVTDIDEIVRVVRFPGWQSTKAGEREVQKALRKTLLKYKLHKEQDLFDKAYGYIRQYY